MGEMKTQKEINSRLQRDREKNRETERQSTPQYDETEGTRSEMEQNIKKKTTEEPPMAKRGRAE